MGQRHEGISPIQAADDKEAQTFRANAPKLVFCIVGQNNTTLETAPNCFMSFLPNSFSYCRGLAVN
jgi:hypothetical protein